MRKESGEICGIFVRTIGTLSLTSSHQRMKIKLVGIALSVNFCHNILVIVVAQSSAHLVIVHVWF